MRVIAGTYRSRPLIAPRGLATRPTSDRLRETLFNVLAGCIEGASFADLYAGSGAVGIEALSRGARQVCFVENSPSAVAAIRANLASLKIDAGFSIDTRGVSAALIGPPQDSSQDRSPDRSNDPWDLVFLDPPYQASHAYAKTLEDLGHRENPILAPGAIVVVEHQLEHRTRKPLLESYGALHRYRILRQGEAALSFYRIGVSE